MTKKIDWNKPIRVLNKNGPEKGIKDIQYVGMFNNVHLVCYTRADGVALFGHTCDDYGRICNYNGEVLVEAYRSIANVP